MTIDVLLSRVQKARATGRNSWIACCPGHEDKTPSMAIRVADDGRILIHCFAGCSINSILGAVGLELENLFPQPLYHRAKSIKRPVYATDALAAIRQEAQIVALAAFDLRKGEPLSEGDMTRLTTAMERINEVLELTQ